MLLSAGLTVKSFGQRSGSDRLIFVQLSARSSERYRPTPSSVQSPLGRRLAVMRAKSAPSAWSWSLQHRMLPGWPSPTLLFAHVWPPSSLRYTPFSKSEAYSRRRSFGEAGSSTTDSAGARGSFAAFHVRPKSSLRATPPAM